MATPFLPAGATTGDSGGELSSGDDSGDMESFQTPEAEATRSLAELFEKAAAHVQGLVQVASREQLLYLYARYKQVKMGDIDDLSPPAEFLLVLRMLVTRGEASSWTPARPVHI